MTSRKGIRVKRLGSVVLFAAVLGLVSVGPAGAAPPGTDSEASGSIHVTVHTHSSNPSTLLFPDVERLSFDFEEGDTFAYSSRICSANAQFNNVGLDFRPDYPGVDDDEGTASVRHQVTGTITEDNGATGTVEGTITTVLCEGGQATDNTIVSHFEAKYRLVSDDELRLIGQFEISPDESTGTFTDMEGHGSMQGVLTCLGSATCAELGEFTDFVGARGDLTKGPGEIQPGLVGTFSDPTVTTV